MSHPLDLPARGVACPRRGGPALPFYDHSFAAPIVEHWFEDKFAYTVVWVPLDVAEVLPLKEYPRLRIEGEVAEQGFEGACMPVRGRWYVMVSKKAMKAAGVSLGDEVEVRFRIADQDAVDVAPDLMRALEADAAALAKWDALTPGKKRGLAFRVAQAKRPETRAKRSSEVLDML